MILETGPICVTGFSITCMKTWTTVTAKIPLQHQRPGFISQGAEVLSTVRCPWTEAA